MNLILPAVEESIPNGFLDPGLMFRADEAWFN
jgi:hypothetical protein